MNKQNKLQIKKARRHSRVRTKIKGTSEVPRLSVFRSNKGMLAQLIDDVVGKTIVNANFKEIKSAGTKTEKAFELGKIIGAKALEKKITKIVFDKGSYRYHGRVKAVAEGAREAGLKF